MWVKIKKARLNEEITESHPNSQMHLKSRVKCKIKVWFCCFKMALPWVKISEEPLQLLPDYVSGTDYCSQHGYTDVKPRVSEKTKIKHLGTTEFYYDSASTIFLPS